MRLDKFLCEMNMGSRSQVRAYIRQGFVAVNGVTANNADMKIEELSDDVLFRGKILHYSKYVYYMLNKPKGVVSATEDNTARTVVSLLGSDSREGIFPVGRLDKDTTGLLILTNDGELAHRLLSPKKHVDKIYKVTIEHPLAEEEKERLEQGVDIGEGKPTLPARIDVLDNATILLTIQEGKFHQVKRMMQSVGNGVLELERVAFGGLMLDKELKSGQYRELTLQEIAGLRERVGCTTDEKNSAVGGDWKGIVR